MESQGYDSQSGLQATNPYTTTPVAQEKKGMAEKVKGLLGGHGHKTDAQHQGGVYGDATPAAGNAESTRVGCLDKIKAKAGVGHGAAPEQARAHGTSDPSASPDFNGGTNVNSSAAVHGGWPHPTNPRQRVGTYEGKPNHAPEVDSYGVLTPDQAATPGGYGVGNPHHATTATGYGAGNPDLAPTTGGYGIHDPNQNFAASGYGAGNPDLAPTTGGYGIHDPNQDFAASGYGVQNPNPATAAGDYGVGNPNYGTAASTYGPHNPNQATATTGYGVPNPNEAPAATGYGGPQPTNPTGVTNVEGGAVLGDPHGNVHEGPRDDTVKKEGFVSKIMDKLHTPKGKPASNSSTPVTNPY